MQSFKQKAMQKLYPIILFMGKVFGANAKQLFNVKNTKSNIPLPMETIVLNNNKTIDPNNYANKKILLVNTASDCGYTAQYGALQTLQNEHKNLMVIAFPANDFKNQEQKKDNEIAEFCSINYGVKFPIAKKDMVTGQHKQPIFNWLSSAALNGWCSQEPQWNFCKYLIDEKGDLIGYFGSGVSPTDNSITRLL